jgi:3-hydroxyacyl-[acyl-carrier-protein] dehydratase
MRYLLIDKIVKLEKDKNIEALKCVALSEDVFFDHFVGQPVMPGAMLIESLAQAATALLEISRGFKQKALLVIVDQAKFREIVRPGNQLSINVSILSLTESAAQLDGTISREDKIIMNGRLTFALEPVDKFYPQKTKHLMESIYDFWIQDAELIGFDKGVEVKNE